MDGIARDTQTTPALWQCEETGAERAHFAQTRNSTPSERSDNSADCGCSARMKTRAKTIKKWHKGASSLLTS